MEDGVPGGSSGSVVPLLVGILGPGAITDGEAVRVRSVVGDVLPEISQAYPHSEVIAVTSMAAGTDTVAAETAHEQGYQVLALLPLDVDDYARHFGVDEAPLADRLALTQGWWVDPGAAGSRDAHYQSCGRLLARLSTTMLVAWNGAVGLMGLMALGHRSLMAMIDAVSNVGELREEIGGIRIDS